MIIGEDNFIKELRKRNEKALEYIMEEYGGLLKSIVNKYLYRLPHLKEECLNDIFFQIWQNVDQFNPNISTFKNWSAGIARYRAVDYLRKYLRKPEDISLDETSMAHLDEYLAKEMEQDLEDVLEDLLRPLNEKDKQIFRMIFQNDKSTKEVAEQMGMKSSAIYNHIHRAKEKIRESLGGLRNNQKINGRGGNMDER